MQKQEIIQKTTDFVKDTLKDQEPGHDWYHTYRVWKLSLTIAKHEKVDLFVVELGALLHDIADAKFHNGDQEIGGRVAKDFLCSLGVDEDIIEHVKNIILNISFKGGHATQNFNSPELDVIQDADRLDGIGAIGIARAFSYGGNKKRCLYVPDQKPKLNMSSEEYYKNNSSTINHFYEKLLLLKDRMNTKTGKKLAKKRHNFMLKYLDVFYKEWDGKQ